MTKEIYKKLLVIVEYAIEENDGKTLLKLSSLFKKMSESAMEEEEFFNSLPRECAKNNK
jgi:hypothetical protein